MTNQTPADMIGLKPSSQSLLKNLKPFDLSAAQHGEQIMSFFGEAMNFIGVRSEGNIVCETEGKHLITYEQKDLRMAPKKRLVWVNLWRFVGDLPEPPNTPLLAEWHNTQELADKFQRQNRIGGKAYPVTIEE